MHRLNASIKRAILAYERVYAKRARKLVASCLRMGLHQCVRQQGYGLFQFMAHRDGYAKQLRYEEAVSASNVVVSMLVPTMEYYPKGTEGDAWFSTTVQVRSDHRASITQLFPTRSRALNAFVKVARKRLLHTTCERTNQIMPL